MMRKGRMVRTACLGLVCLLALGSSGCAGLGARSAKQEFFSPPSMVENDSLRLSVEEFATQPKSPRFFDFDLTAKGVLALHVKVENVGQAVCDVSARDFAVGGTSTLRRLTPEEAATKAKRSAVGEAVGWSLIVPVVSIPVAALPNATFYAPNSYLSKTAAQRR